MILNAGLDAACTTASNSATAYPYFGEFVRYAAIGTGSTEPAPTDTALNAQVGSRTDDRGGFNDTTDAGRGDGALWHESTFTRVFNITSNVNAAEWGLAIATTGPLSVRELFRADPTDNTSAPIALTLEEGDQLQLVVTLRVEAEWGYQNKSFIITGTDGNDTNGTHTGLATVTNGAQGGNSILEALRIAWPGGIQGSNTGYLHALMSDQTGKAAGDDLPSAGTTTNVSPVGVPVAYTAGDHYRDVNYVLTTATANGDIHAVNIGSSPNTIGSPGVTNASVGYRYILTNPPYLTKASTHRLTLTLRKSISRL